jgi:hypothetical protein
VGDDLDRDVDADIAGAGEAPEFRDYRTTDVVKLGSGRIAQFDIEREVGTVDPDVPDGTCRDIILLGIGIDQLLECRLDGFSRYSHGQKLL